MGELVYTGTDMNISRSDVRAFLENGPGSTSDFTAYPITMSAFADRIRLSERKLDELGIRASHQPIRELTIDSDLYVPLEIDPVNLQPQLLTLVGRSGVDEYRQDDLSVLPCIALFAYQSESEPKKYGQTSWYRPPEDTGPSGTTFRDVFPPVAFQYVAVHEMGHYLGLNHRDHRSPSEIMWKPAQGTNWGTLLVAFFLTSGPTSNFTVADSEATWRWITTTARARESILG